MSCRNIHLLLKSIYLYIFIKKRECLLTIQTSQVFFYYEIIDVFILNFLTPQYTQLNFQLTWLSYCTRFLTTIPDFSPPLALVSQGRFFNTTFILFCSINLGGFIWNLTSENMNINEGFERQKLSASCASCPPDKNLGVLFIFGSSFSTHVQSNFKFY